jgi:hypothetical protein
MNINTMDIKTDSFAYTDFAGTARRPRVVNGDSALFMARFKDLDPTTGRYVAKDFSADGGAPQALRLTVRATRDPAGTLLTCQYSYNQGFRASFEDLTAGQVTWLVSFNAAAIDTLLASVEAVTVWMELTYLDFAGIPSTLWQGQIEIVEEVDDGATGTPPPTSPTYLTAAEIALSYLPYANRGFWPAVVDKDLGTPPGSPAAGDTYIVPAGATGAWSGHTGKIAFYQSTGWLLLTPATGWTCYVVDESKLYTYRSGAWALAVMMTAASPTAGHVLTVDANGQATDSGVSLADMVAQLSPMGTWNANTNTPDISGAATGDFYIVSVDGATDLGGITDWKVNDWALKTATGWAKVDNSESGQILMDSGDTFGLLGSKLDANSLEVAAHVLRSKVDGSSIERSASGLRVKAGGVTNAMLAGGLTADKLVAAASTNLPDDTTTAIVLGAAATYQGFRMLLRVTYGTAYLLASVLVCHDGTNANVLAAEVYQPSTGGLTGGKITFAADLNTGNVRLLVTTASVGGAATCKLRVSEAVEV